MDRKAHWERVYSARQPTEVGWYQCVPSASLKLIESTGVGSAAALIDVGAGASTLVDELLGRGFAHVTALDLSEAALAAARRRLGRRADRVSWVVADITAFRSAQRYDLWHDRAVFHFLTEAAEREKYRQALAHALKPGGHLIISCFSEDGPDHCSGLDVARYTASGLATELGTDYTLLEWFEDIHVTPSGGKQKFLFCRFQRSPGATET